MFEYIYSVFLNCISHGKVEDFVEQNRMGFYLYTPPIRKSFSIYTMHAKY
jgi:hypothetical protein